MRDPRPTTVGMTVGERIRARMLALGLNQPELAKKMHVSKTMVGYWVNDKYTPRNDKIPRLAGILGIDPSALSPFGGGTVAPIDKDRKSNYVVLLGWDDLHAIGAAGKMKMSALKKPGYIEVDIGISAECIALRVDDSSMEIANGGTSARGSDSFRKGDIIIVDPNITPIDGDYVLVRLRQTKEHLFRLYVARGKAAYDLVAANPDFPTVTINAKFPADVIGVLVEHRRKRHT